MITVAIPYWRTPDHIQQAVRSVLSQTWRDLQLVVMGDGEAPPLAGIRDDRLTVYTLPENRGRYFCDAVMLAASRARWYAPSDSDDWWEPNRLETLMLYQPGAVVGNQIWHQMDGSIKLPRYPQRAAPVGPDYHYRFNYQGVYERSRLLAAGGYHPGYRMGYDTFLCGLLHLLGPVSFCPARHYHRIARPDSLVRNPATNMRSESRMRERSAMGALYYKAWCEVKAGRPEQVPWVIQRTIAPALAAEVAEHADRLGALIA